jgi:hypothetical protein
MSVVSERANIRSGTTTDWASGPVLGDGELGIDTTKKILKIGDGTTSFASLGASGGGYIKAKGRATLVAGTKATAVPGVVAGDEVIVTVRSLGTVAAPKALIAIASADTVTITSSDNTDTSVVSYVVLST